MLRLTGCLTALLVCLMGSASGGEKVLVSLSSGAAELVDLVTLKSLAVTKIGSLPLSVAVTNDRRFGLVACIGATTNGGSVAVLDLNTQGMPVVATVCRNGHAHGVAAAPNNQFAIVSQLKGSASQLQFVDLTSSPPADLGAPIAVPGAVGASSVEISPDGKTAYVLDSIGATFSVFDLTKSPPVAIKALATNPSPTFLRLSNDGRRLVIPSIASPTQAGVWNTGSSIPTKTGDVAIGNNPVAIPAFDPGNRFAVVIASSARTAHVVAAHVTPPVVLGTSSPFGSDLRGVAVNTDGLGAWASCISCSVLFELDLSTPSAPVRTTRSLLVSPGPHSLVAFGAVHAHGVPATGSAYPISIASPNDAGRTYVLGASFGSRPGFKIGTRTVPLNPDPLLSLSQQAPSIFKDFIGVFDRSGQATATLNIPAAPALRGFSFVVAGVIVDSSAPQNIGTITNAERIVLQ